MVDTAHTATVSCDAQDRGSPEVMLAIGERGFVSGPGERLEGSSTYGHEDSERSPVMPVACPDFERKND